MNVTQKNEAFTMIEILIVSIIIGSLALMLGRGLMKQYGRIKRNQARTQLAMIKGTLLEYYAENTKYPKELIEMAKYFDGDKVPLDPWSEEFIYNSPPIQYGKEKGYKRYELYSTGPDKDDGTDDDIIVGE